MEELPIIDLDIRPSSIIKVMGVGGGGCNAVNYLYNKGVEDISFLVCNTDRQALERSPVPSKLQLGKGLGAGGRPEAAREAAEASRDNIREALSDDTQMLFITAGMGGGTGTGASPVVAEIAQEMGILTVAIVTIPFAFEGKKIIRKALRGIARLADHVDALLVINNEKLKLIYPDFDLPNAFNKSDEVVSNAAKSIAEIITVHGYINTDFQDVYNTLHQGGVAIMNVGESSDSEQRITKAIQAALSSPLINNTNVRGAQRILMNFYCSHEHAIRMTELDQINEFIERVGDEVEVKWGASYDESLGEEVRVTLIATGYPVEDIPGLEEVEEEEQTAKPSPLETRARVSIDDAMHKYYGEKEAQEEAPAPEPVEEAPAAVEEPAPATEDEDIIHLGFEEEVEEESAVVIDAKPDTSNEINFGMDDLQTPSYARPQPSVPEDDHRPAWLRRRR